MNAKDKKTIAERQENLKIRLDRKQHLLLIEGSREIHFGLGFLGARDNVGANCTCQASMHSFYDQTFSGGHGLLREHPWDGRI